MPEEETDPRPIALIIFLILITGAVVNGVGDSIETDKQALLNMKSHLEDRNPLNRGRYAEWNQQNSSPCDWPGILCFGARVTGIDLSGSQIAGDMFGNFSSLTALTHLDLSRNTVDGAIPADLGLCQNLKYLNLSHNIIGGVLNLTGLSSLEVLDLTVNRFSGTIQLSFPAICNRLILANISANNFTGEIGDLFSECPELQYLDLSTNNFSGDVWLGFGKLRKYAISENNFNGIISPSIFSGNCSLKVLDLSGNSFVGEFPKEISNCKDLVILNLWGNNFTGKIPAEIGSISGLEGLYLGSNNFFREIPESLLGLSKLAFLNMGKNNFGGDIQEIFGKFRQVKFLVLHNNSYTGGLYTSGILKLPIIERLDLSLNNFSGPLPVEISEMMGLKFLILAYNNFSGNIPPEYGKLTGLQALDLSFNQLNGSIPPTFGNLTSLLWLMLANNALTGEIPLELGDCNSLLWLNLANNQLSGTIPTELTNMGLNATPTFQLNKKSDGLASGSGECLVMRRWIPANYPPFSFVYTLLTWKSCRNLWDKLLKGYGLFPVCAPGSTVRTLQITGYVQLSGNQLSGKLPLEIGKMQNFSMLQLGENKFNGSLPPEISQMPLVVLNISQNEFSGEIPMAIGDVKCLQNLDLSYNNFSGRFPTSLNNLNELSKFNISYNPNISGVIPTTGQFATFEKESYFGDPLLLLPPFIKNVAPANQNEMPKKPTKLGASNLVFFAPLVAFLLCGVMSLIVWLFLLKKCKVRTSCFLHDCRIPIN
ncbi:probable LRR receptor-like serine/threonine-protein kinase At1g74360 [Cornus florida]|uniref:probable LRR receptor-like serine/threonine-protein kinase At1g74360 n=1 Tax=Cornus florida TaxID=4283 RepID=UPI0028996DA2|nr:probable LRR receptor-like serine/threonine-protein kinase At1g74360 [Cornus florida]